MKSSLVPLFIYLALTFISCESNKSVEVSEKLMIYLSNELDKANEIVEVESNQVQAIIADEILDRGIFKYDSLLNLSSEAIEEFSKIDELINTTLDDKSDKQISQSFIEKYSSEVAGTEKKITNKLRDFLIKERDLYQIREEEINERIKNISLRAQLRFVPSI